MSDVTIQLDAKHRAHRVDNQRWVIQKANRDGVYDMIANWTGNRRSLLRWLEDNKIHPSREAESKIAALPERNGFKEDAR